MIKNQKKLAKTALTASIATLVATSFIKGKSSKNLHKIAGIVLVASAFWHTKLNKK